MDFKLSPKHQMLKKMFREFAENELGPIAAKVDEMNDFDMESADKMAKAGFLGIPFPQKYGGGGADELAYAIAIEELSRVSASHGISLSVHTSLCAKAIELFGNEEQKMKYLTRLASGQSWGAFGLTEPGAGTDAGGTKTTAVLDGDEYILNGTKVFTTNAGVADIYLVHALTDPSIGSKGLSSFIVEKGTPGFTFGRKEDKMGIRGSVQRELLFSNCRVPKENLVGKEGIGFKIAMTALDGGRIGVAAQAVGIAQAALEEAIKYSKERIQFRKPISANQAIQWMIADMTTRVEAARLLVYNAALMVDDGKRFSREAAMAKLFAAETAKFVTERAVQIHGGYGYMKDYKVERFMRDAKITEIYEGTSEVMRMVISGAMLK